METKYFRLVNNYLYNLGITDVYLDLLPCTFGVLKGYGVWSNTRVNFEIKDSCMLMTDIHGHILCDKRIIYDDKQLKLLDYEKQKEVKGPHWWSPRSWLKWLFA